MPGPEGGIDLGGGVYMRYFQWSTDRDLNPQYDGIPDEPKAGIIVGHVHDDDEVCEGAVTFDTPTNHSVNEVSRKRCAEMSIEYRERPMWQVGSWEPLTLSPSILMSKEKGGCGLHGFIRDGRWVGA